MFEILAICKLRVLLLARQKLGIFSLFAGFAIIIMSYLFAEVSFVHAQRIYWDFVLAGIFITQVILSLYLSTQLVAEEFQRRTLQLMLCAGISKTEWLIGNLLGLSFVLTMMNVLWTALAFAVNYLMFPNFEDILGPWVILQNQFFLILTSTLILLLGIVLSILVRPLLALSVAAALTLLIYSLDSIRRLFLDAESARYVRDPGVQYVVWVSKILPPLNWLNLKDMISYYESLPWTNFLSITVVSVLWMGLLLGCAVYLFEKKDL